MAAYTEQDTHGRTKETPQHGRDTWYAHGSDNGLVTSPYYNDGRTIAAQWTWVIDTTPA